MFSHAGGVKTLPSMHCDRVLLTFIKLVASFDTESLTDNGQQVVNDCNIDL